MRATDKLRMLADSGVIDDAVRVAIDSLLPWMKTDLELAVDTDGVGQMLVTHLAMATERARQGTSIDPPAAEDRAITDADRDRAASLLHRLGMASGVTFHPGENAYVTAYLSAARSAR